MTPEAGRIGAAAVLLVLGLGAAVALRRGLRANQLARQRDVRLVTSGLAGEPPTTPAPEPPPDLAVRWVPAVVAAVVSLIALETSGLAPVGEVVAWTQRALGHSFQIGETSVTPLAAMQVVGVLVAGVVISRWVQRGLRSAATLRGRVDEGVVAALQRLAHYLVLLVSMMVALEVAGFDLSTLLAAGAVLGVGVGFGLQNLVTNFVAGLMLLMERSIKPGDLLTVDGRLVRVVEMGIRATIGRTLDDDDVIIPNGKLIESWVINHSHHEDLVRARVRVRVGYDCDLAAVQRTLEAAASSFPDRLPQRDPVVLLDQFHESAAVFDVSVWVKDAWIRDRALSKLRHAVWGALREAGVTMAFPQLDVHVVPPPAGRDPSAP